MDSLTQLVLGAAVGAVAAGPFIGARRAALMGAVIGTLPDLDTLIPYDDPVESFVKHRSITHSLIVHTLLAPLLAWPFARWLHFPLRHATLAVWLALATHALLDAMTIYGTQLLWPLSAYPFGSGSLFIIDPLYTLPLLALFIAALFQRRWTPRIERGAVTALLLSTGYAFWSLGAQAWAEERARQWVAQQGPGPEALLITPMPFSTLFWKAILIDGRDYLNVYVPLLGDISQIHAYRHPRVDEAGACALQLPEGRTLEQFAKGLVRAVERQHYLTVADLRMGVTPDYVFTFALASADGLPLPRPIRYDRVNDNDGTDWSWLLDGILGRPGVRPAERQALLAKTGFERRPAPRCDVG